MTLYFNIRNTWSMDEEQNPSLQFRYPKREPQEENTLELQGEFHFCDFSTPKGSYFNEEYEFQNDNGSQPIKKKRNFFTCFQKIELEEIFSRKPYPSREMCVSLARKFGSNPHSMKIWFKNRRARQKKTSSQNGPMKHVLSTSSKMYSVPSVQAPGPMYIPHLNTTREAPRYHPWPVINKVYFGPAITSNNLRGQSAFSVYQRKNDIKEEGYESTT